MLTTRPAPSSAASAFLPRPARVLRVVRHTEHDTLFEVRFEDDSPLGHAPGQFVQVSIAGVGECPISLSSSPTRAPSFDLTVRRVGEVTTAIHRLRPGDEVGIRGPFGHGVGVAEFENHDVLIVCGGCALAPARSLIQFILDKRERFGAFCILYGARSPAEMLFRDELEAWTARPDVLCRSIVDHADATWRGPVGVVTKLFDETAALNIPEARALVIGPPTMFRFAVWELISRKFPPEHLYCSLERRMKCGIGKCGHCQVNGIYSCVDGPVFNYARIAHIREALE